MIDLGCDEALLAAVPARHVVEQLREKLSPSNPLFDVYLAYGNAAGLNGLLLTERHKIDEPVAYCPIHPDLKTASAMWRLEVRRQLANAIKIARAGLNGARHPDCIRLSYVADETPEIPSWIYSITCVPITYAWEGRLHYPRPFCPRLFERMATQPRAVRWLQRRTHEASCSDGSRCIAGGSPGSLGPQHGSNVSDRIT